MELHPRKNCTVGDVIVPSLWIGGEKVLRDDDMMQVYESATAFCPIFSKEFREKEQSWGWWWQWQYSFSLMHRITASSPIKTIISYLPEFIANLFSFAPK